MNQIKINQYEKQNQIEIFMCNLFLIRSLYSIHPNIHQSFSELYLPLEKRFHNGLLACQVNNQALDKPLITSYRLNIECKERFLFCSFVCSIMVFV